MQTRQFGSTGLAKRDREASRCVARRGSDGVNLETPAITGVIIVGCMSDQVDGVVGAADLKLGDD